jgi:hypothetical protein
MKPRKVFQETPSREFRDRVMAAARAELAKLRDDQPAFSFWSRRWVVAGGFAAVAALALRLWTVGGRKESQETAGIDLELLENADLLDQLDLIEDLDVLETLSDEEV